MYMYIINLWFQKKFILTVDKNHYVNYLEKKKKKKQKEKCDEK